MMATSSEETCVVPDGTVCSICYDSFKTPRYLPCKHSFCHDCLYSYIANHSKTTESHLGFHCPLCRDYIPNTRTTDNPEEWTRCFSENRILEKYVSSSGQNFCEACLRESEEEKATHFCLNCNEKLCANCIKYHKRGLTTRKHETLSLSNTSSIDFVPYHNKEEVCIQHQDRPIELFCQDHEEPCCTMCVNTIHRKCEKVELITETASKLKKYFEGKQFDLLLEHVGILEEKLVSSKNEQELCVRQMENTLDRISEETERVFEEAFHHLQFLKNQYLTNMTKGVKEGKVKYEKNINSLLDGIYCTRFIVRKMAESKATENAAALAVAYYKGKNCFDQLKMYDFQQLHITMEDEKPEILKEIMELTSVTDLQFLEKTQEIKTDLKMNQLCLITEISIEGKFVRDGTILSSGDFILSTRANGRYGNGDCFIYDKYGKLTKRVPFLSRPFGIIEINKDIIVACSGSKFLNIFNNYSLNSKKGCKLSNEPFCITHLFPYIYVAYGDGIVKVNRTGVKYATFSTGPSVKHITSTRSNIVYSNRKTNEVVAMDGQGKTAWRYSSPDLRSPCGLSVDGEDNIYVAGKESDNVHVLSKDGQFVRVFEDITRPDFMKVDKERKLCFVGSMRKYVRVYEIL